MVENGSRPNGRPRRPSGLRRAIGQLARGLAGHDGSSEPTGTHAQMSLWEGLGQQACAMADVLVGDFEACALHSALFQSLDTWRCERAADAVARAVVSALAGERVTAFVGGPDRPFSGTLGTLERAVRWHAPLVVVQALPSRGEASRSVCGDALHGLAPGPLIATPQNAQRGLDLMLVLTNVAERALVPGLLAVDAGDLAYLPADLRLPDTSLLATYLRASSETLACPTPLQQLTFGNHRRRVPRWFDRAAPRAIGSSPSQLSPDMLDAATCAEAGYARADLGSLVQASMSELATMTGRPLPLVSVHGPAAASLAIIAHGPAVEVVAAVATQVRREHRLQVRVLGVDWLRPFPAEQLRKAMAGARQVVVLERGRPATEGGLLSAVRACLACGAGDAGAPPPRLVAASYGPTRSCPRPRDVGELMRRAHASDLPDAVHLGVEPLPSRSRHPDRQAVLDRIRSGYPEIDAGLLSGPGPLVGSGASSGSSAGDFCLAVLASDTRRALRVAECLVRTAGERTAAGVRLKPVGRTTWLVRLATGSDGWLCAADDGPVDLVVADAPAASIPDAGLSPLRAGGIVLVRHADDPGERRGTDADFSPSCRRLCRARELRLFAVAGDDARAAEVAVAFLQDVPDEVPPDVWPLAVFPGGLMDEMAEAPPDYDPDADGRSRLNDGTPAFDSLTRYWSERAGPARDGELDHPAPEPDLAFAVSPPGSVRLQRRATDPVEVPTIDGGACTGCGRCWSLCPDGALAPRALATGAVLAATLDAHMPKATRTPLQGRLARAARQWGAWLDHRLATDGRRMLDRDLLEESARYLVDHLGLATDERQTVAPMLAGIIEDLASLAPMSTPVLFHERPASRALLLLGRDGRSCQGCGICEAECPEQAIHMEPTTRERWARMRAGMRALGGLPNTPEPLIEVLSECPELHPLAATLLDDQARTALCSGGAGAGPEPGSGAQLAVRLISALASRRARAGRESLLARADALQGSLRAALREQLSATVSLADLHQVEEAAREAPARPDNLEAFVRGLKARGQRPTLDAPLAERRAHAAGLLGDLCERLVAAGATPFAAVVAHRGVASWYDYPDNPFRGPLLHERPEHALSAAAALARRARAAAQADAHLLRVSGVLAAPPADLLGALDACATEPPPGEESQATEPIVVLLDPRSAAATDCATLATELASELRLCIVLLDDLDTAGDSASAGPAPNLVAPLMAFAQQLGVACSTASVSDPAGFANTVAAALACTGPSLLYVPVTSPQRNRLARCDSVPSAVRASAKPSAAQAPTAPEQVPQSGVEESARNAGDRVPDVPRAALRATRAADTEGDFAALRVELHEQHVDRLHASLMRLAGLSSEEQELASVNETGEEEA